MFEIREEPIGNLSHHAGIASTFRVEGVLEVSVVGEGLGGSILSESPVGEPWVKDNDVNSDGPKHWAERFDVTNWGLLAAHEDGQRVGGAVVAFNTSDVYLLEGRSDLAVLWDLRVSPEERSAGIG